MGNPFTVSATESVGLQTGRYGFEEIEELWNAEKSKDAYQQADPKVKGELQNNFINKIVIPSVNPKKLPHGTDVGQIVEDWTQNHMIQGGLIKPQGSGWGQYRSEQPKYDNMTGVTNPGFIEKFGMVETNEEKGLVFDYYGLDLKDDYYIDADNGAFYVTPSGADKLGETERPRKDYNLKVAPDRLTPRSAVFHSHTITRMMVELLAAAKSRGASAVPAGLRLLLTGAGMKYLDEGLESLRGFQAQTKGEVSWDAFVEGALAGGAEWATRLGGMLTRFTGSGGTARVKQDGLNMFGNDVTQPSFAKRVSGITGLKKEFPFVERGKGGIFGKDPEREIVSTIDPETRRVIEQAMGKVGLQPDLSSLDRAGYSKVFSRLQELTRRFGSGIGVEKTNLSNALRYLDKLGARSGARVGAEGVKVSEDTPFKTFASGIKKDIKKIEERLALAPKSTLAEVDKYLGNAKLMLDKSIRPDISLAEKDNLGKLIVANMEEAYKAGSMKGRMFYQEADQVVVASGVRRTEWIPTARFKQLADEMLENIPIYKKKLDEPYFDQLADGSIVQKTTTDEPFLASQELISQLQKMKQMGDHMTFHQAKGFRELMTGSAYDKNLLTDVGHARAGEFKRAMDAEFDDIVANGKTIDGQAMPVEAVKRLKRAINYWSAFKSRWDNAEITKLVKEGSQEPYKIVQHMDTMTTEQIGNIMKIVGKLKNGKNFQASIRTEHFDRMMKEATNPSTGEIVAQGLLKQITKMGDSFYKLHGKDSFLIERYARDLAARNYQGKLGKDITDELLSKQASYGRYEASPRVVELMKKAVKEQGESEKFIDDEFVKIINGKDEAKMVQVIRSMLRPNGEGVTHIKRMRNILKDHPERQSQIEKLAFKDLINTNLIASDSGTAPKTLINGQKLLGLTKQQFDGFKGDNAFVELFGEQLAKDIDDFAKATKTFSPKLKDGIVEQWMALHPFDNFNRLVQFRILGTMMAKPGFLRFFLDGYKQNFGGWLGKKKTADTTMAIARFAGQYMAQASQQAERAEEDFYSLPQTEEGF